MEVWGPEQQPDANCYSLVGDPGGIAVNCQNLAAFPNFTVPELATAIGLDQAYWSQFDVDGLMTSFNEILFSIAPVANFDGGEIWVWNKAVGGAAQFLNHGGHLWNTEFDVMGTFGTESENVDALEAVATPEPTSTLGLMALSSLGVISMLKRKLKQ